MDGANRHDMKLVERTLEAAMVQRPEPTAYQPQNMCLDKGCDYPEVRKLVAAWGYTGHIKSRGEERAEKRSIPGYRARRWIVERTHSWLNRFRRLLIRWEKKWRTMWLCFISLAPGLLSAPAGLLDRLLVAGACLATRSTTALFSWDSRSITQVTGWSLTTLVELEGLEPSTSSMPLKRSPS